MYNITNINSIYTTNSTCSSDANLRIARISQKTKTGFVPAYTYFINVYKFVTTFGFSCGKKTYGIVGPFRSFTYESKLCSLGA